MYWHKKTEKNTWAIPIAFANHPIESHSSLEKGRKLLKKSFTSSLVLAQIEIGWATAVEQKVT